MAIDDLSVSLDLVAAREYFCRLWNALDPDTKRLIIKAKVIACLDDELGEYMQLEANFYMRLCEEYSRMMVEDRWRSREILHREEYRKRADLRSC